jgi:hypothetical protein
MVESTQFLGFIDILSIASTSFGSLISIDGIEMRDPKQVEAILRMSMNPRNWVDSTMSFAVNARGDIYDENSGSYESYEEKWRPGTYNLSASMQIIKFEEPNPSQRQPKMSAEK